MANNSSDANSPLFMGTRDRPKDILGAISEIEILSAAEEGGSEMSERFATLKERMDYMNLGIRSMFTGTILSLLLAPLAAAVINQNLPIFGNFTPTLYDKIISYIISFGYSLGYIMLFVYVAKIRGGTVSNIITNNLMVGMSIGVVLKLIVATFIYGLMYFVILTEENLTSAFMFIKKWGFDGRGYYVAWYVVLSIRRALIASIYLYAITSAFMLLLPWATKIWATIKIKGEKI